MSFTKLTPEIALEIYRMGCFPMAERADDKEFKIYEPIKRSLLPFENLHVSKSLRKRLLKNEFEIRFNTAFADVITACGETNAQRDETWINKPIRDVFIELHQLGHAHSVEAWKDGELVGGLYGLQLGSAFCGESMFSRATDASKVALVHLCARLKETGFTLLDAQLENPHLEQFGQILITQKEYLAKLELAQSFRPDFMTAGINPADTILKYLPR